MDTKAAEVGKKSIEKEPDKKKPATRTSGIRGVLKYLFMSFSIAVILLAIALIFNHPTIPTTLESGGILGEKLTADSNMSRSIAYNLRASFIVLNFLAYGTLPILLLICIAFAVLLYLASFLLHNKTNERVKHWASYFVGAGIIFFATILAISIIIIMNSMVIAKPVIYLYSEKSMPVRVNVEIMNGHFTKTDPAIDSGNGWDVIANPNGEITWDGKKYPYLFYEADSLSKINTDEGWVVPSSNISSWFNEMLPRMGLSENETRDFTDYWNQNLPKANYYRVRLLSQSELNSTVKLNIQPKPDTVIRVILVIERLDKPVETVEPNITTPERKGFTAIEWGVILK